MLSESVDKVMETAKQAGLICCGYCLKLTDAKRTNCRCCGSKLHSRIKDTTGYISKIEGKGAGDWVLLDAGDVIVHVFRPEVREFYQLEKMWLTDPTDPEKK